MITDKKTLQEYLAYEKTFYLSEKIFHVFRQWIMRSPNYLIWHYQKILRICEYHYNVGHRIRYAYFRRRKNIEGARLGIYINHNSFEKGLHIYHYGSIIAGHR